MAFLPESDLSFTMYNSSHKSGHLIGSWWSLDMIGVIGRLNQTAIACEQALFWRRERKLSFLPPLTRGRAGLQANTPAQTEDLFRFGSLSLKLALITVRIIITINYKYFYAPIKSKLQHPSLSGIPREFHSSL